MNDINLLKQALPYFRKFKGNTFLIKFGGEPLRSVETLEMLAEDLSFLHSIGIRVVVVHGGGPQVTEMEKMLGAESQFVAGRRVTDEKSLEALKMVLAGKVNIDVVAALRKYGVAAVGLNGVSGGLITARKRPPVKVTGADEEVDFGHVGDVDRIDATIVMQLLDQGYLPVIAPLSADHNGNILNINADTIASRLAATLKANKLLFLSNTIGVMTDVEDKTTLISQLNAEQAREAIKQGIIKGGMIPKVEEALRALGNGVSQVHVLSGVEPHSVLVEVFTESGCGTMMMP